MKMRVSRSRLSFMAFRKRVWVDRDGKYGPTITGSTYTARMIRIKHHSSGFRFGMNKLPPRLFKRRGLPTDWMQIAEASGFYPIERYPSVWDVFDRVIGDRHHDLYRKKSFAWLACYRATQASTNNLEGK